MLKHFVKVYLRDMFIVVAVIEVKRRLVKDSFVVKQLFDHFLIRFKVDSIREVNEMLPLLSHDVTVPLR
jgi:hypothetical protein